MALEQALAFVAQGYAPAHVGSSPGGTAGQLEAQDAVIAAGVTPGKGAARSVVS